MSVDANAEFLEFRNVDKIKFIGTSSNTIIDTTTGRLGIGTDTPAYAIDVRGTANVTALSGITDFNFQPTSNTASIEYDSNVVTEFNRSKKLIKYPRVAMTGSTSGGYTASANAEESDGRAVWKLFDNTGNATAWRSEGNGDYNASGAYTGSANLGSDSGGTAFADADKGDWVKIQLPHKIKLGHFTLQVRNSPTFPGGSSLSYGRSEFIKNGKVWGSNDGTSWSLVHTIYGTSANSDTAINSYTVTSSIYYRYFGLVITDTNATVTGLGTSLSEIELYGLPEYDPDADGMDVKVTSYPNVPNTDWLEVYYDAKEPSSYPGTGGTVLDLSGNQIDGTLNGGVGFDSTYKAFTFDEADDYITLDTGKTGNYTFSVSIWFKSSGNSVETLFHMNGDYATNNTVWLYGDGTNLYIDFINNSYSCDTGKNIADNMWHHASFVYNGNGESGRDIYLDGIHLGGSLSGSSAGDNLNLTSTSSISRIGALNHSSGIIHEFKGSIANFRLFNRAITSNEVWQLYSYQKEYFGHGDLSMTLKAGRLGIGTSEPRGTLDVRGDMYCGCPVFWFASSQSSSGFLNYNLVYVNKGGGLQGDRFVAPISGYYHMTLHNLTVNTSGNAARLRWYLNGTDIDTGKFGLYTYTSGHQNLAGSLIWYMKMGDYMQVSSQDVANMNTNLNGWSGFLLST